MKETRKGARGADNRSFVFDSAKLECLLEDSARRYLNILMDADDHTIAHSWISLRRPDAHDLQKELTHFFSE